MHHPPLFFPLHTIWIFFSYQCVICPKRFKFKAQELNRKILEGAEDPKRPPAKEPTVPEGFQLQVEKRLHDRQAGKAPQEEEPKFKAQPLPKKILEGVVVSSGPLCVSEQRLTVFYGSLLCFSSSIRRGSPTRRSCCQLFQNHQRLLSRRGSTGSLGWRRLESRFCTPRHH